MVCKRFQLFSMIIEFSASLTWLYASYSVNHPTSRYQLYLVIHIVHSARVRLKAGGAIRLSRETACIWVPFKRWKWMIIITVAEKKWKVRVCHHHLVWNASFCIRLLPFIMVRLLLWCRIVVVEDRWCFSRCDCEKTKKDRNDLKQHWFRIQILEALILVYFVCFVFVSSESREARNNVAAARTKMYLKGKDALGLRG